MNAAQKAPAKNPNPLFPVPLYVVIKDELLEIERFKEHELMFLSGGYLLEEKDIINWDSLKVRWDLLELDKLHDEINPPVLKTFREKTKYAWSSYAQPRVNIIKSIFSDTPKPHKEEPKDQSQSEKSVMLSRLNTLIVSGQLVYRYASFPKRYVNSSYGYVSKLGLEKGLKEEQDSDATYRQEQLKRLNRLLLEELFPNEINKIDHTKLGKLACELHQKNLAAICLSGGGIRSATFSLGILQGLARKGLLNQFDYLSTVSGGGYVGSWLTAWLHHEQDEKIELEKNQEKEKVFNDLEANSPKSPLEPECRQIQYLRNYSNYLAPKLGFLSADGWVLIATYFRNLLLNWLVFIPFLLAVCAVPRLYLSAMKSVENFVVPGWLNHQIHFIAYLRLWHVLLLFGIFCAAWAVAYAASALPGAPKESDPTSCQKKTKEFIRFETQTDFLWFCLLPLIVSALALTTLWIRHVKIHPNAKPDWLFYIGVGLLIHLLGVLGSWGRLIVLEVKEPLRRWPFIEGIAGILFGFLLWVVSMLAYRHVSNGAHFLRYYATFAVPLFLLIFLLSMTFLVGLFSKGTSDEDREWWARMGAWILIVIVFWFGGCLIIFFAPVLLYKSNAFLCLCSSVGGLSGIITLVMGHNPITNANDSTDKKSSNILLDNALNIVAAVFFAAIIISLSMITGWLIYQTGWYFSTHWEQLISYAGTTDWNFCPWSKNGYEMTIDISSFPLVLIFIFGLLLLGAAMSLAINLNKFSLNAVYRNRLVRAYLGASNPDRKPNLFTGFDPDDNIELSRVRGQKPGKSQKPFHLINMTLNLVHGKNLAWQQRKAETFTVSKRFCGNIHLGFRPSAQYALTPQGSLSLGTAVSISGAAVSPNMGYHSSPLVCFLMTLFNIRLGAWLGNPGLAGQKSFYLAAPRFAPRYVLYEALGLTDNTTQFVFLSDGGHFEDLGLYEMVLRRCKFIVVSDADSDPDCALEDLGNAIRKIRIDLGVNIEFKDKFDILSRNNPRYDNAGDKEIGKYCAIAEIDYTNVDPGPGASKPDDPRPNDANSRKGILIYIKPALCGREPKDIFNYKQEHLQFPHDTTANQFFTESQFESYRALGLYIIETISDGMDTPGNLENFKEAVKDYINRS